MKLRNAALFVLALLALPSAGLADFEIPLKDVFGADSGWSALVPDHATTGIVVDQVGGDYVRIEVAKTFDDFDVNVITFYQRLPDAQTVATIRIDDEIVHNNTGGNWTRYLWAIDGAAAALDKPATEASVFDVSPFTSKTWGPTQAGWSDPGHVAWLLAGDGVVADGETFSPGLAGGSLYIDVDLSGQGRSFQLKQMPIPEPATLVVLATGAAGLLIRCRRER